MKSAGKEKELLVWGHRWKELGGGTARGFGDGVGDGGESWGWWWGWWWCGGKHKQQLTRARAHALAINFKNRAATNQGISKTPRANKEEIPQTLTHNVDGATTGLNPFFSLKIRADPSPS